MSSLSLTSSRPVDAPAQPDGSAVSMRGVVKRFASVVAVNGLELEVPTGVCYGLLGPNGAGKSTTMRILTGQAVADAGSIEVLGYRLPAESKLARARMDTAGPSGGAGASTGRLNVRLRDDKEPPGNDFERRDRRAATAKRQRSFRALGSIRRYFSAVRARAQPSAGHHSASRPRACLTTGDAAPSPLAGAPSGATGS